MTVRGAGAGLGELTIVVPDSRLKSSAPVPKLPYVLPENRIILGMRLHTEDIRPGESGCEVESGEACIGPQVDDGAASVQTSRNAAVDLIEPYLIPGPEVGCSLAEHNVCNPRLLHAELDLPPEIGAIETQSNAAETPG